MYEYSGCHFLNLPPGRFSKIKAMTDRLMPTYQMAKAGDNL